MDTFRIRAHGDATNPVDPAKVEATAYCEAIVQRTPELMPGFGRRFVTVYFRWLAGAGRYLRNLLPFVLLSTRDRLSLSLLE